MISSSEKKKLFSLILDLGKEVELIKQSNFNVSLKADKSPVSQADLLINNELAQFFCKSKIKNVISEENNEVDYALRKKWEYFWLLDPIDGTKEFITKGKDYTINVALCLKNKPIFSIVYAPARNEFYTAEKGNGARLNNKNINVSTSKELIIVASKSHLNEGTKKYIQKISSMQKVSLIQFGSSLKICKIAEGKAHLYPRFGPTMEWDTCAADLILEEAGGLMTTIDKKAITYNKKNLMNPFFIASASEKNIL